ncbi:MAG TPA: UbiA family prenyltransferase [Frankiaceae bacterium]|nr:UbiA family prenyltransferase [Frankiaceae bacterium]
MIALARAAHIQPAVAVTAMTSALGVAAGRGGSAVWLCLAMLTGQLFVGWSNDWLDSARDVAAGRTDKPVAAGSVSRRAVGVAALLAVALCVPFSLLNGAVAGLVHLAAVASAGLYNAFLKRTVASPVPYAFSFGSLPWFVTLGLPGRPAPPWWSYAAAALLGVGAHFVNTLPDQADDVRLGVRGLPQRIGRTPSLVTGAVLLVGAGLVLAAAPPGAPSPLALALAAVQVAAVLGVVVTARLGRERASWTLTLAAAVLAVALLLANGASLA